MVALTDMDMDADKDENEDADMDGDADENRDRDADESRDEDGDEDELKDEYRAAVQKLSTWVTKGAMVHEDSGLGSEESADK